MRLIDADALLQTLSDLYCADNNVKTSRIVDMVLHDLMTQIIKDEPTVDAQPVWIKCSDELPDIGVDVILWKSGCYFDIGHLTSYNMWSIDIIDYNIKDATHWMPLPEPPEVTL